MKNVSVILLIVLLSPFSYGGQKITGASESNFIEVKGISFDCINFGYSEESLEPFLRISIDDERLLDQESFKLLKLKTERSFIVNRMLPSKFETMKACQNKADDLNLETYNKEMTATLKESVSVGGFQTNEICQIIGYQRAELSLADIEVTLNVESVNFFGLPEVAGKPSRFETQCDSKKSEEIADQYMNSLAL